MYDKIRRKIYSISRLEFHHTLRISFLKAIGLLSSRSALWHLSIRYGSTAEKMASYSVSHIQLTEWFLQQSQRSCFSVTGTNKMEINLCSRFSMMFLLLQTLAARSTLNSLNMWQYISWILNCCFLSRAFRNCTYLQITYFLFIPTKLLRINSCGYTTFV